MRGVLAMRPTCNGPAVLGQQQQDEGEGGEQPVGLHVCVWGRKVLRFVIKVGPVNHHRHKYTVCVRVSASVCKCLHVCVCVFVSWMGHKRTVN